MRLKRRFKRDWKWLVFLVILILAVFLARGFPQTDEEVPADEMVQMQAVSHHGGNLRVGIPGKIHSLDPHRATTDAERVVARNITDSLFRYGLDDGLTGGAVADWEELEQGPGYLLTLREGLTFSDGTPCDAEAVAFNLKRMREVGAPIVEGAWLSAIAEVEVVDERRVMLKLKYSDPNLLFNLSRPETGLVSPNAVEQLGDAFSMEPIGLGPFVFDWEVGLTESDSARMLGDHIGGDPEYGDPIGDGTTVRLRAFTENPYRTPNLDTLTLVIAETELDPELLMEMGFDILTEVPAGYEVSPEMGAYRFLYPRLDYHLLALNLSSSNLSDRRVREALALAIDRKSIIEAVFQGDAHPLAIGEVPIIGLDPDESPGPADPERARDLLEESGYSFAPEGVLLDPEGELLPTFNLLSDDAPERVEVSRRLADQLRRLGLQVELEVIERHEYYERMRAGDYDLSYWVLLPGLIDPSGYTANLRSDNYWNVSHIKDHPDLEAVQEEVDDLLRGMTNVADETERSALFDRFADLVSEHYLYISLWNTMVRGVACDRVVEFEVPFDHIFDFSRTRINEDPS